MSLKKTRTALVILPYLVLAIWVSSDIVYAWTDHNVGGPVYICDPEWNGWGETVMLLDVDGNNTESDNEAYLFIASDNTGQLDQGFLVWKATGATQAIVGVIEHATLTNKANAVMSSTAGAKVRADANGDVVITIGTSP